MKNSHLFICLAITSLILEQFGSIPAHAQATSTFTAGSSTTNPYLWNDSLNWSSGIPNSAGETAVLSFAGGNGGTPVSLDLATTAEEVGVLDIGTTDSVAGGTYTLESTGGASLTLNNNGNGAQILETATSVGDTISAPLIIADSGGLNITTTSTSSQNFTINGAITGTGNLTLTNDNPNAFAGLNILGQINNVGTLTSTGTSTGYTLIRNGGVGSNVTSIIQNSNTSNLYFASSITVASGGTTIINNANGYINSDGGQGVTGTGNVTLENNGSNGNGLILGTANNVGQIFVTGKGASSGISTSITSNVTGVTIESNSASSFVSRGGLSVNSAGTTLTNNSSTGAQLYMLSPVTGTGNLIINNNGTQNQGVQVAEQSIDNVGYVVNSGTGSGSSEIGSDGNATILGSSLMGVIENSTTSSLDLALGGSGTVVSGFTGVLEVKQGTMSLTGDGTAGENMSNASKIIVGDTAAHGTTAFLLSNFTQSSMTLGASQTISGFGTFEGQSGGLISASGSTLAPGSTGNIGKLTLTTGLTLVGGTNLTFELGTGTPSSLTSINSSLLVEGNLTLPAATLNLNLLDNGGANGQGSLGAGVYDLLSYDSLTGASAGNITSLFDITAPTGYTYQVYDTGTGVGQIDLSVTANSAVPEPSIWALMIGGIGLLLGFQKLRRHSD